MCSFASEHPFDHSQVIVVVSSFSKLALEVPFKMIDTAENVPMLYVRETSAYMAGLQCSSLIADRDQCT